MRQKPQHAGARKLVKKKARSPRADAGQKHPISPQPVPDGAVPGSDVQRSIELSSPASGRPFCLWHLGFNSELITEEWTDENAPLAAPGRAVCESDLEGDQAAGRKLMRFTFTVAPRKVVVYHKDRPHLRVIEVRDELRDSLQAIKYRGIEIEGDFRLREIIKAAQPLFDELFRIERRGRPKGKTDATKRTVSSKFLKDIVARLPWKNSSQELRDFTAILRYGSISAAAKRLKLKVQTLHKRFVNKIEPTLIKIAGSNYDRKGLLLVIRAEHQEIN